MDEVFAPHGGVAIVMKAPGRKLWLVVAALIAAVVVLGLVAARGTGYTYGPAPHLAALTAPGLPSDPSAARKLQAKLVAQNKQYATALEKLSPAGTYVVVDQTQNRLYLMNDDKIVRTAVCSAGSGLVLKANGSAKTWVFDTPRGVFKVRSKVANPLWKKPDWAFAEEGKTIPKNPADRFESGTLGKYALYLEDGYMIHGTLYTRLLGRSVTHGCIRLGPEDLQAVWDAVPLGSSVYIF
jgi:lipoprotein-anchoring transpeptidase ErfK/SrfK